MGTKIEMNKLKFETNSFGIKRCIINTNSKWCDYSIYESFDNLPDTNSTKVLSVYTRKSDDLCGDNDFVPESFIVDLDFETKEFYSMVEQEKDQIIVYYFPIKMMLGFE